MDSELPANTLDISRNAIERSIAVLHGSIAILASNGDLRATCRSENGGDLQSQIIFLRSPSLNIAVGDLARWRSGRAEKGDLSGDLRGDPANGDLSGDLRGSENLRKINY